MNAEGTYIYAIIAAPAPVSSQSVLEVQQLDAPPEQKAAFTPHSALRNPQFSFGAIGIGGAGAGVYTVCHNDLAAVVSASPQKKYKVSRENLLSHEKAIEAVMAKHTVLPVRFGTVADNEQKVKLILARESDRFRELLSGLEGKRELGLKTFFNAEQVFKTILNKYGDIRTLKQEIEGLSAGKTYYLRAEVGQKVAAALELEKEARQAALLAALTPLAAEVKVNAPYGDLMILNAAFLVELSREMEFDRKVQESAEQDGALVKYKYIGVVPPFNFVNLAISMED